MPKNIELEIRTKCDKPKFAKLQILLQNQGTKLAEFNRLSVMYFGEINQVKYDLRVRITNGQAEMVIKKGDWHATDRIEIIQAIQPDQLIGLAKALSVFGFHGKVQQRKNIDFQLANNITASLINIADRFYGLELEKMTDEENKARDEIQLRDLAKTLDVSIIEEHEFYEICTWLTNEVDYQLTGQDQDWEKIQDLLTKYL